jgi:prophage DNA circulation protein
MGWKEQLQTASFRGVKFKVESAETAFGRRNQVHEYPKRDEPYSEDLGKKAREYTFSAYVLGDNYFKDRDALLKAIEDDDSPGTLIHPTLGRKTVVPKDCRVSWSNRDGGIEYFTLTFIEAGEKKFPASGLNTKSILGLKADALMGSLTGHFDKFYKVTGFIEDVATQANGLLTDFSGVIDEALRIGGSFVEPGYSSFRSVLSNFKSTISTMVPSGSKVSVGVRDVVAGLSTAYGSKKDVIRAQTKVFRFGSSLAAVAETTPSRTQQAKNQDLIVTMVRGLALAQIALAVADLDLHSKQDALRQRDETGELFEQEALAAGDTGKDEIYQALEETRVALAQDINRRAVDLPNLTTIRTSDSVPVLAFAYNLYEDAARDQEIIDRNRVRNPVFLPGGAEIEVLL